MGRKRKIIVYIAPSVDGFIAQRDGSADWLDRPRPKGKRSIDTILWGRKNVRYRARLSKEGRSWDGLRCNYVFTHSLPQSPAPAGVEFVSEPIKAFATHLR